MGKSQKCDYCGKEMIFAKLLNHEEKCRAAKKICDGYGNCKNKGVFILTDGKERSRWCPSCLARFKKEHPKIEFEFKGAQK